MRRSRIVEGSCWRCRQRRIKCDLLKPTCKRCHETQQTCGYGAPPFKWVGGAALRGKNAPAAPGAHGPRSPTADSFISAHPSDGSSPRGSSEGHSDDRPLSGANTDVVLSRVYTPSVFLDESHLLPYFANAIIPRFLLGDGSIPVDLDSITKDESLQKAMVAVSRAHYDVLSRTGSSNAVVRNKSRHLAITAFRKHLVVDIADNCKGEALFANNVLLCMLDGMIEPTNELNASSMHLKGGFAILNRWPSTITDLLVQGGLQSHLLSIFVTMDLVHALLSGRQCYFESSVFYMYANTAAWWACLPPGDRLLDLFKALSELAALGRVVFSHLPSRSGTLLAERCLPATQVLLETLPPFPTSPCASIAPSDWARFCCLFEVSGNIYIQRAIRQLDVDDETVQAHTSRGVSLLMEDLTSLLEHCTVLPILVIGAHCIQLEDRRVIERALSLTAVALSFGNLQTMLNFLKSTWAKNNVQATWWDMFSDVAEKIFPF